VSRRDQIKMSHAEVAAFLTEERTVTCATVGPRGWPHLMPLWYVLRAVSPGEPGPRIWAWTYGVSQKVRNLERDLRASLQVEAGEQYQELRGVMLECDVVLHRDLETVSALGQEILTRYASPRDEPPAGELPAGELPAGELPVEELSEEVSAMVAAQAAKRVGLEFVERRRATWDHRKLGEVY
jgi:nitroimidazol reductase NimA-like FMN-containing flavoprotein (pyridoxamine 5'-phosphate oxidase superfamily)